MYVFFILKRITLQLRSQIIGCAIKEFLKDLVCNSDYYELLQKAQIIPQNTASITRRGTAGLVRKLRDSDWKISNISPTAA